MNIRDIMKKEVISVKPGTPIIEAVKLLIERNISGLPVVDDDDSIVGVITEKDLLRLFYDEVKSVGELMTPRPLSFPVDAPMVDVVDCLMAKTFRRVLIHEDGKLVGLVSRADLMPAILGALLDRTPSGETP